MPDLSVGAIGVASRAHPAYRPVAALAGTDELLPLARAVAEFTGVPLEHLEMLDGSGPAEEDVSALALAALGSPAEEQPLFLVRSGPPPDPHVAALAQLVHHAEWGGEDIGITHLDELGGTVIFDLLAWAVPPETGATALICDDPLFIDARLGRAPVAAVGLRVRRGPGPLRVLGCGEGAPGRGVSAHRFEGGRPCDGWLALHAALRAGRIAEGDRLLLHTRGPRREGWLSLQAADLAALRLSPGPPDSDVPVVPMERWLG